jgi:hypothetical protein
VRVVALVCLGIVVLLGPAPSGQALDAAGIAQRTHLALMALDRYLEGWNSRDGVQWAKSLHFPHVRPGPGAFELTKSADEYAKGVDFTQTLKTGWHHSEWVSRAVLQVGIDKVHAAGRWQRYTEDGRTLASSDITYVVTNQKGRWGVQSRFAAGTGGLDGKAAAPNSAAALAAIASFFKAWNSHDPKVLAASLHFPHVRLADDQVEIWNTAAAYLAGPEPGRQRTWYETRLDESRAVQTTANGVNVTVSFSRVGRDRVVLAKDEGLFLVVLRDGAWKVQARSTMGS